MQLDFSTKDVFEWGSGNSSTFFAKRSSSIISIEVSEKWYNLAKQKLLNNQHLILSTEEAYTGQITTSNKSFDVIIIDGLQRERCAEVAPLYLKPGGMIIYDNSERDPDVCEKLRKKGYIEIDFHGFGPINFYSWTTSLFFKDLNFQPLSVQPQTPQGGLYETSTHH